MKKFRVISTILLVCVLMLSMGVMVFGYDESRTYFVGQKVDSSTYVLASQSSGVTEAGTYPTVFMWNSNKTSANYYYGYKKKLADGTYGGATGDCYTMMSSVPSGAKTIKLKFSVGRWKPYISGGYNSDFRISKAFFSFN